MGHEISVSSKTSLSLFLDFNQSISVQSTGDVSFWQVASVAYLLLSWKRRWLAKRKIPLKPLDNDKLTPKEEAQMLAVFDAYPTAYSYRKCAIAGKGSCSKVYRAVKVNASSPLFLQCANECFALKEMVFSESKSYNRRTLIKEIQVMKTLNHENCIRFHEAVWEAGYDKAWIVMEYADCGDLTDLIDRATLREDHMAAFCKEVSASPWPICLGRRFYHFKRGH
jgi:serine/threonine protein kinase